MVSLKHRRLSKIWRLHALLILSEARSTWIQPWCLRSASESVVFESLRRTGDTKMHAPKNRNSYGTLLEPVAVGLQSWVNKHIYIYTHIIKHIQIPLGLGYRICRYTLHKYKGWLAVSGHRLTLDFQWIHRLPHHRIPDLVREASPLTRKTYVSLSKSWIINLTI